MPARKKAAPRSSTRSVPKARFGSVAVLVSDKKRSTDWYTKQFGLEVVQSMGHWITVGRKGQGGLIHLCQTSDWSDEGEVLEPGNQGIQFQLPGDFEQACAALEANGVKFTYPPVHEDWGWWARVVDPDGNEITLGPED